MEFGNYTDHIQIGHSGDAIYLLDQLLNEEDFDQEVVDVLKAIKDALEWGII